MSINGLLQQRGSAILYVPEFKIENITTSRRRQIILILLLEAEFEGRRCACREGLKTKHVSYQRLCIWPKMEQQFTSLLKRNQVSTVGNKLSSIRSTK
jgi:hypothetical protein